MNLDRRFTIINIDQVDRQGETMPQNIEIKARANNFEQQISIARDLSGGDGEILLQEDTFFKVPKGRLKLRIIQDGTCELIQYNREDKICPTESSYSRMEVEDPETIRETLAGSLGVCGTVKKMRRVFLHGRSRIHFDTVYDLGEFIEIEVVLESEDDSAGGVTEAEKLMATLGILDEDLVRPAYVDLLMN